MANPIPLTVSESVQLMRQFFKTKGLTEATASLLEKQSKTDKAKQQRWLELQLEFDALKAEASKRKQANRSDKGAKAVLHSLTPTGFDAYKVQAKHHSTCETGGEIHRLFSKGGYLSAAEKISLLSNSKQSAMKPLDVLTVQRLHVADDPGLCRVANAFCKRFGLK